MERLKNFNLIKTFFIITIFFIWMATMLANISIDLCIQIKNNIYLSIQSNEHIPYDAEQRIRIINTFQILFPTLLNIGALLISSVLFYRLKIKKPLIALQKGVERIQRQDLDFKIEKYADDELGKLCEAFETMRFNLLKSNQELWRQMDERKRLNAAFAHDLRNPVTVLKGSVAILNKNLEQGIMTVENTEENLLLINQYTERIENYINAMTSAQKLEDLQYQPQTFYWSDIIKDMEISLSILAANTEKEIEISSESYDKQIRIDKYIVYNTAENLTINALRYAKKKVTVYFSCDNEKIIITVSDDGPGFSDLILKKGAIPFLRDNKKAQSANFGMGLYICRLLSEKHGGSLILDNHPNGAKAIVTFYFEN